MTAILCLFSFGVASPDPFQNLNSYLARKGSTFWQKKAFFKFKMDALTALSIWDTEYVQFEKFFFVGLFRAKI